MRKLIGLILICCILALATGGCTVFEAYQPLPPDDDTTSNDDVADPGDNPDQGSSDDDGQLTALVAGQIIKIPNQPVQLDKAKVISQGRSSNGNSKRVALTFDSGWIFEPTSDILKVLHQYNVKATFFMRGGWVEKNPDLVQAVVDDGHEIGNHSLTHGHMTNMSREEVQNELRATANLIENFTGKRPYLFRPPFGEYNELMLRVLAEEGYTHNVMWTVDTLDWKEDSTVESITARATSKMVDGCIILMHVGSYNTPKALPEIIERFRDAGFEFVTVGELVGSPTITVEHEVQPGETWEQLARQYNLPLELLVEFNKAR